LLTTRGIPVKPEEPATPEKVIDPPMKPLIIEPTPMPPAEGYEDTEPGEPPTVPPSKN
jgi:hypothetical protein